METEGTFSLMTDEEFDLAVEFAKDEPSSRFALFMERTAGYRFFHESGVVCTPKYELFHRFKNYPRQLEMIERGEHPDYRRIIKPEFDKVQEELWNGQERI
jgi:hypothetical protein